MELCYTFRPRQQQPRIASKQCSKTRLCGVCISHQASIDQRDCVCQPAAAARESAIASMHGGGKRREATARINPYTVVSTRGRTLKHRRSSRAVLHYGVRDRISAAREREIPGLSSRQASQFSLLPLPAEAESKPRPQSRAEQHVISRHSPFTRTCDLQECFAAVKVGLTGTRVARDCQ